MVFIIMITNTVVTKFAMALFIRYLEIALLLEFIRLIITNKKVTN